ncbi:MAG: DUF433 domain-containing protein [Chloroflexota bacterium]|nr:MAG: DUF433 domain-containing protein [Chloroflexota bacterium]
MSRKHRLYEDRIVVDPAIMVGKPVVRGTRIPVELVLKHLSQNPDLSDLFAAFPRLTLDDVKACLEYAQAVVEGEQVFPLPEEDSGRNHAHA